MNPIIRFLNALRSLTQSGAIKSIDEAMDFAKREFGEVNDLLKRQIEQVFKRPQGKTPKPGEGGITSIKNAPKKKDETAQASGSIMDQIEASKNKIEGASNRITEIQKEIDQMYKPKPETSPLMERLGKGVETLKAMKQPGMDLVTGLTRTAARSILNKQGIQVPEKADAIDVFVKEFGADALMDVKNVAEEMIEIESMGKVTKSMDEILEQTGMFNIKRDPNAPKGISNEELEQIKKEVDQEKLLKDFDPTDRTENSMGGINRIGYADGPEDPKKKKGIMKALKKVPKIGKLIGGLESIMGKYGTDAIGTLEDFYKKGKLKVDPNKAKYDEDRKAVFDFQMRQLNKTEADANKEMDAIIKDQIEGGFIRDMEKSMQKDMQRELKKPEREILDVPPVPEGFKLSKEKLMAKFPELDEAFADEMVNMDKDTAGRLIKMLENRRLDPEAYDRLLAEFGDTLQFQKEFDKYIRRKKNAEGGLQYLMGM
jgi:hypothetical protein